jgi:hypothetical protein
VCAVGRYDLVVDMGARLLRVQCKWAARQGNVLTVRCATSRHTQGGYLKSTYSAAEIDAIAAYASETDSCHLIPIQEVAGHKTISLRLTATRNKQAERVRWARDYELLASLRRNWGVGLDELSVVDEPACRAIS